MPIYNPAGKYMVRLKFNGVSRRILVDDRLPLHTSSSHLLFTPPLHTSSSHLLVDDRLPLDRHGRPM